MAAKPKLSPAQWTEVRGRWEGDPRKGFPWIIEEMGLPVSAEALRLRSKSEGWAKGGSKAAEAKPREPSKHSRKSKLGKTHESKLGSSHDETVESEHDGARSVGRPTLYRDEYVEQVRRLALLGLTNDEMAKFFGVGPSTFDRWMASHDEFRCAINESKLLADGDVALSLYKRALGYSHPDVHISNFQGMITVTDIVKHYPPDTGAAFIWLKNRQPHKWKDKVEVKEDINLNIFPPKEVLKELFEASLKRSTEKAAMLTNRRERLGIVIEAGQDVD